MCFTKVLTSAAQPPVWERAYAVTEIKRCVEGAAGTRGTDKAIAESALRKTTGKLPADLEQLLAHLLLHLCELLLRLLALLTSLILNLDDLVHRIDQNAICLL